MALHAVLRQNPYEVEFGEGAHPRQSRVGGNGSVTKQK